MSKNIVETEGPHLTSQYGAYALRAGYAKLYVRIRMHTSTRSSTHMHARTRKHAHTPISNTYRFSTATMIRERV
jgi:hypothetical protein